MSEKSRETQLLGVELHQLRARRPRASTHTRRALARVSPHVPRVGVRTATGLATALVSLRLYSLLPVSYGRSGVGM